MNTNNFIVSDKQMGLDLQLVPYDLWATKVHVLMLVKQKIIPTEAAVKIIKALCEIEKEYKQGKFTIDPGKGLHLTVEALVLEKIGEKGYFMHTARSRNDQVATGELIYLKEKTLHFLPNLFELKNVLLTLSKKHLETVMPGYTHMQPAKPTTFAQWCLSYFDMLSKSFDTFIYVYQKYDLCPLGSVESYGTSWKIDREYTAKLLGFSGVWEVTLEAISSRGFVQLACLSALKEVGVVLSKMAADLLLFNTFEFGYLELAESDAQQMNPVTGSSVMPQKKNPDVLELVRSLSAQLVGFKNIVANLLSGLPMGYNRDSREVKEYLETGFEKATRGVSSLAAVLENMVLKTERMKEAVINNYSLATDLADYIAQKTGFPYRKIYQIVGKIVKEKVKEEKPITTVIAGELKAEGEKQGLLLEINDKDLQSALDPLPAIKKRIHTGGPAPQVMEKMIIKRQKLLTCEKQWLESKWLKIKGAKEATEKAVGSLL